MKEDSNVEKDIKTDQADKDICENKDDVTSILNEDNDSKNNLEQVNDLSKLNESLETNDDFDKKKADNSPADTKAKKNTSKKSIVSQQAKAKLSLIERKQDLESKLSDKKMQDALLKSFTDSEAESKKLIKSKKENNLRKKQNQKIEEILKEKREEFEENANTLKSDYIDEDSYLTPSGNIQKKTEDADDYKLLGSETKRKRLSQSICLSEIDGLSASYISKFENGKIYPTKEKLALLIKGLNMNRESIKHLFGADVIIEQLIDALVRNDNDFIQEKIRECDGLDSYKVMLILMFGCKNIYKKKKLGILLLEIRDIAEDLNDFDRSVYYYWEMYFHNENKKPIESLISYNKIPHVSNNLLNLLIQKEYFKAVNSIGVEDPKISFKRLYDSFEKTSIFDLSEERKLATINSIRRGDKISNVEFSDVSYFYKFLYLSNFSNFNYLEKYNDAVQENKIKLTNYERFFLYLFLGKLKKAHEFRKMHKINPLKLSRLENTYLQIGILVSKRNIIGLLEYLEKQVIQEAIETNDLILFKNVLKILVRKVNFSNNYKEYLELTLEYLRLEKRAKTCMD